MLMISHVSTSSISIMMTPAMCTMAYALTRDADSQCAAFAIAMHTKHTVLAPFPRSFKFGNTIVASLGTATICFQTTSGELMAYDTDVIQLNVPALLGLLLMRVANADVLVSSMQLRSPTWSADLRDHGGHLYVKKTRILSLASTLKPECQTLSTSLTSRS
jgi:hypothetical protein